MIKKILLFSVLVCTTIASYANETGTKSEIDAYWKTLARTVAEGDSDGYRSLYHDDAVIVKKESGESYTIDAMMTRWLPGFKATAAGKMQAFVEDRFKKRILGTDTAWESGIFHYWTIDETGKEDHAYIWFESLLVKKKGKWLMTMELQAKNATREEWESLAKL